MGRHDWYRNTHWTPEVERAFAERFNRSRSRIKKVQYLRIQGLYLIRSDDPSTIRTGIVLTQRALDEFPEAKGQRSSCLHAIGDGHKRLGEFDEALIHYRAAWAFEQSYPNAITNARSDLALLLIEMNRRDCADEIWAAVDPARDALSEKMIPLIAIQREFARATVLGWRGRTAESREHALKGLAAANVTRNLVLQHHPSLGLVSADSPLVKKLKMLLVERGDEPTT